jgi:uncharacterized protein (DUF2147 family)
MNDFRERARRMREVAFGRIFHITGFLGLLMLAVPGSASAPPAPLGEWVTANGHGVVQIAQCGDALCGRIVGIDRPPGAPMPTDAQGKSQCGLMIITDETRTPDGGWLGHITDPRDGSTYQAQIWVDGTGELHLRGFVGIPLFGQTQIWHRFTGRLTSECRVA